MENEIPSDKQNNHIFLVVNRDNLASLNPKDWGAKTLIIDSWREEVYKASDYDKYSEKNLIPKYQGTYTFDK